MKRFLLLFALLLSCPRTDAESDKDDAARDLARRLDVYQERLGGTFRQTWIVASQLKITGDVSEYEAYVLSAAYLYAHIDGCSRVRTLIDEGFRWVADTEVGLGQGGPPDPGPPIFVEKATGATSSRNNKTVTDPKTYLELVRR